MGRGERKNPDRSKFPHAATDFQVEFIVLREGQRANVALSSFA
jgi:hypothetical protein